MATTAKPVIQPRDRHLLSALYFSLLTIEQALFWSKCWSKPFTNWKKLYDRLEELRSAGLVQRFRYALATSGASPNYYKLSKSGYRRLLGCDDATPPGRYSFSRISRNEELHTIALADFLVSTFLAANRFGCMLSECYPDRTVALLGDSDERPLYPDFLFTLATPNREQFHFCVELDRHTESIRSDFNRDALAQLRQLSMKFANFKIISVGFSSSVVWRWGEDSLWKAKWRCREDFSCCRSFCWR